MKIFRFTSRGSPLKGRSKNFIFLLIGIFLFVPSIVVAKHPDEVIVRTSIDKNSIFIGERIRYAIDVLTKHNLEIEFPKFKEGKIGDFEIKDSGTKNRRFFLGGRSLINWYAMTTYSIGEHQIPSFEIRYRLRGKKDWLTKKTGELKIVVMSVLPRKGLVSDMKDIKGPIYFYEINWILISGFVALSVFCILAIRIYKRKRITPLRLPHEIALEELEAARAFLSRTGDVKGYYIKICDCVRHYVERRFILKAPEMTTEEFLDSLRDSTSLTGAQKNLLKEFLGACDLVKFAKYAPTKVEAESIFVTAKNFASLRLRNSPSEAKGNFIEQTKLASSRNGLTK